MVSTHFRILTFLAAATLTVVLQLPLLHAKAQLTSAPAASAIAPAEAVPPELQNAQRLLMELVEGIGRSARVSYERQADAVRFRVDLASLGSPKESIADGELAFDSEGLTHFRIESGLAYERHQRFKRRAKRLGLGDPEIAVLLDGETPRFPSSSKDTLAKALPLEVLRVAAGETFVVEDVSFEGRRQASTPTTDDELVASWRVAVRVGAGRTTRRYLVTVEPFGGAIIAIDRK